MRPKNLLDPINSQKRDFASEQQIMVNILNKFESLGKYLCNTLIESEPTLFGARRCVGARTSVSDAGIIR